MSRRKWRVSYSEPEDNDPQSDTRRLGRGGSWYFNRSLARRVSLRGDPDCRRIDIGFRMVRVPHL